MKNMKVGKNKPRHYAHGCAQWTHEQKLRKDAIELSKKQKQHGKIIYDFKN